MFWPNMAALTQELVAEKEDMVPLNAMVMSTAQGGWMIAGAVAGFLYQKIGLADASLDASTYFVSVMLMFSLRKWASIWYTAVYGRLKPATSAATS